MIQLFETAFFAKNTNNLLVELLLYITILYSIINSNKLMIYLFWSPTKTINFLRIYDLMILNLLKVSYRFFLSELYKSNMLFNQQILPSLLVFN
jgi:hypothetical protein